MLNFNRRQFLQSGFGSVSATLVSASLAPVTTFANALKSETTTQKNDQNFSIANVSSVEVQSKDFNGDNINRPHDILWNVEGYVQKKGGWPKPEQKVKVVVVGGGMSGLLSAYFLKDHQPVILEQDSRLGGNSKGEIYNKSMYSIGAAYITVPDEGSTIEKTLNELGLSKEARLEADSEVKVYTQNEFKEGFWTGATDPARAQEFIAVAEELKRIYENEYPEIPFTKESQLTRETWVALDQMSFKTWLEQKWPGLHPHILEYFQLYAWSSFNGSIEELSALQMLNFITAETAGVLALPGGNSLITYKLQQSLLQNQARIESGAFVLRVETKDNEVVITYETGAGELIAISCEACVMAAPKFVAQKIVPQMSENLLKNIAMIPYRGYIVANVILDQPIQSPGFDVYALTGTPPQMPSAMKPPTRVFSDVCFGTWAQMDQVEQGILTIYKPLPFDGARQFLFNPASHDKHQNLMKPEIEKFVGHLGLTEKNIRGVRLTRWGHSIPVARTGWLAEKNDELFEKPVNERIYFANQDNFVNPAFETAFAAAEIAAQNILTNLLNK